MEKCFWICQKVIFDWDNGAAKQRIVNPNQSDGTGKWRIKGADFAVESWYVFYGKMED